MRLYYLFKYFNYLFCFIQYTCYDVSKNYIVCGATSGSLYIFRRHPSISLIQLIPNLNGPLTLVSVSPFEHFICFTTTQPIIKGKPSSSTFSSTQPSLNVYRINFETLQPIISSYYLHEVNITQIKWKRNENQLYFGDMNGNISLVNLNNFLVKYYN